MLSRIVKQTEKTEPCATEQIHEEKQSPPPTRRTWTVDDAIWHTSNEDEQVGDGPFSLRDLRQRALQKQLEPKALIWRKRSNGEWISRTLKELMTMAQGRRGNHSRTSTKSIKRHQSKKTSTQSASAFLRRNRKRIISFSFSIIPASIIAFLAFSLLRKVKIHSIPDAPKTSFFDEESLDNSTTEASPSATSTGLISFSQCRGIAINANDLDYAHSKLVSLLAVRVKDFPTECNPCRVPAHMRDGTELMLMTDTLDPWRNVIAEKNHLIDVCGMLNHRMANVHWVKVKVMRHSVYSR